MQYDILCVGLMVCDIMVKPVSKAVFDMDSIRLDTMKMASGGDAMNTAVDMAKLGVKVGLVGRVGNDGLGDFLRNEAKSAGIDTRHVRVCDDYSTSTSIVLIEEGGERHFAYYGKTNDTLCPEDIPQEALQNIKILQVGSAMALASLEGEALAALYKKAHDCGAMTSLDLTWDSTGAWLSRIEPALCHLDIFFPSYEEACAMTGLSDPRAMKDFFRKYGLKIFGVKMGEKGCYVTNFIDEYEIPAFLTPNVVDTTGAGDSFMAGFLSGIVKGWDIYRAGVFANAVAHFSVQALGASAGIRSYDETVGFVNQNIPNLL